MSSKRIAPKLKDAPGELVWINKADLTVDHSYQRNNSAEKARKIAANWSWLAFGVLTVAWRKTDIWAVVDGQHRHAAAMLRPDITDLPCLLFEEEVGVAAEAEGFATINTTRRPLHAAEVHKARCIAGDPVSLLIDRLVTENGRTVATYSGPTTVACVSSLLMLAKQDQRALVALWPVIANTCEGHAISNRIVGGMHYLETRMLDKASLTETRWKKRLAEVGVPALNDAMNRFQAAYARGGDRIWALGVREAIDHGLRNRLPVKASFTSTEDCP